MRPPKRRARMVNKRLAPARRRFSLTTRHAGILPSFLIIGAQRAGTTTLFANVCRHPDVEPPRADGRSVYWPKELHFFDENYWRGAGWYRAFFPYLTRSLQARLRGRRLACGEATPYYLFHPAVPERVAETLPDVRLIALLRNPVERTYSHYQHTCKLEMETLSFEEALEAEGERLAGLEEALARVKPARMEDGRRVHHHHFHRAYVSRSLYADQLERWLAVFPRGQLLVLRSEDFLARPDEVLAQVFDFIGVRQWRVPDYKPHNVASYEPIDPALRARLEQRFAEPNARLSELLGADFTWASPTVQAQPELRSAWTGGTAR